MASACVVLEDHVRTNTREKLTYTCRVLQLLKEDTDPTEEPSSWKARALILHSSEHKCTEDSNSTRTAGWAGPGYCLGAHRVPQQDTKADFLHSSQHPQRAPAAICKLGLLVEPEETRVSSSIYESTHTTLPPEWDLLFKTHQSISWELDTSCHRMLSSSPKCSCREVPTEITLEKKLSKIVWLMYKSCFTNLWKQFDHSPSCSLLPSGPIMECLLLTADLLFH